jgi:SnoaL-like protein
MAGVIENTDVRLGALLHRQDIMDCLHRYTRGVDRVDVDLIRSAFWPDAVDHHGPVTGSVEDFLAYWLPLQPARQVSQHYVANTTIDIDDDIAHVETYFTYFHKAFDAPEMTVSGGRYADRFERREDGWRIILRVVIREWSMVLDGSRTAGYLAELSRGRKDRSDPTYARPLVWPPGAAGNGM